MEIKWINCKINGNQTQLNIANREKCFKIKRWSDECAPVDLYTPNTHSHTRTHPFEIHMLLYINLCVTISASSCHFCYTCLLIYIFIIYTSCIHTALNNSASMSSFLNASCKEFYTDERGRYAHMWSISVRFHCVL